MRAVSGSVYPLGLNHGVFVDTDIRTIQKTSKIKSHSTFHLVFRCRNKSCNCESFFYIVAEGAWILRCRCKHKHIDHDPNTHQCKKPNCACEGFLSPWVCNCNHPWSDHRQKLITKEVANYSFDLSLMMM